MGRVGAAALVPLGLDRRAYNAAQPGPRSEAPSPLLVGTPFTLDAATRVYLTPCNYEGPGGVEWVTAD